MSPLSCAKTNLRIFSSYAQLDCKEQNALNDMPYSFRQSLLTGIGL